MPSETLTPRTEAQIDKCFDTDIAAGLMADFARRLEQELNEALHAQRSADQSRDDYRECCESMARVLKMHDQSQISLTIPEWEEMKKNTLEAYAKLQTESQKP